MYEDEEDEAAYSVPIGGKSVGMEEDKEEEENMVPKMPMGMAGSETVQEVNKDGVVAADLNPRYEELVRAWQAEENGPEILNWQGDLYAELLEMVKEQEAMVQATIENADATAEESLFVAPLYQADIARVKYVLTAYVRARLEKLQRCAGYIAKDEEAWSRLSDHEQNFMNKYLALLYRHHRDSFVFDLPREYGGGKHPLPSKHGDEALTPQAALALDTSSKPDLDTYVFIRVLSEVGDIHVGDEQVHDTAYFAEGDMHIVRYGQIRHLIFQGDVELI